MIQFNLLPDVKLAYIKAERVKRLVISISVLAGVAALAIFFVLLFSVDVLQKKNLNDINRDIKTDSAKVESTPNLNKILTIQNQLAVLPSLHDAKPASSRIFNYLGQVTPSSVTVSNVAADFTADTITISGNGNSLDDINTFVDTLKFTTYTTEVSKSATKAFSDVVLSGFSRTKATATYSITLKFDPTIFNITHTVNLTVPNTVTTRSVTEQPTALFKSEVSK